MLTYVGRGEYYDFGEAKMKEVKIYEEDIQEAYNEGCEDTRKALKRLYPGLKLGKKEFKEDITGDIQWRPRGFDTFEEGTYYWLLGYYRGTAIFCFTHLGIGFNDFTFANEFKIIAPISGRGFKVLRK